MKEGVTIQDLRAKQKDIETKLSQSEIRLEKLEESIKTKTDGNDVLVQIEQMLKDKQLVTKTDLDYLREKMEASVKESQVSMIKWLVGTSISLVAAITGLIQIL